MTVRLLRGNDDRMKEEGEEERREEEEIFMTYVKRQLSIQSLHFELSLTFGLELISFIISILVERQISINCS